MALTLSQIQQMITDKGDPRQILNEIADYLQANPGGGSGGVESVTGDAVDNTDPLNPVINSTDSISVAVVDLTDAQIKLADTAIEIIPAPGENKMINFIYGYIITKFTGSYGNIPDDVNANIAFTYGEDAGDVSAAIQQFWFSFMYGQSTRRVWYFPQTNDAGLGLLLVNRTDAVNKNVSLFLATVNAHGDLTGGHANNTMRVIVGYTIQDIP